MENDVMEAEKKPEETAEVVHEKTPEPDAAARIEGILKEYTAYREEVQRRDRLRDAKESLHGALRRAGVMREELVQLLGASVDLQSVLENEGPYDPAPAVQALKEKYGVCFAREELAGLGRIAPPVATAPAGELSDNEYYRRYFGEAAKGRLALTEGNPSLP